MVSRLLKLIGLDRPRDDWARLADRQQRRPRPVDPDLRERAQILHRQVARFLQASDPWMLRGTGVPDDHLPAGTDWRWRPRLVQGAVHPAAIAAPPSGQPLGADAALWHDCPQRAVILRQVPRPRPGQAACYGLQIEVLGFAGSFLSLALDLPGDGLEPLGADRIVQLDAVMDAERPITIYARLNLVQGPNTETLLRQLGDPVAGDCAHRRVEFDLAYGDLSNRPVQRAWLDLILERPAMNAVTITDLVVSHRLRAQV